MFLKRFVFVNWGNIPSLEFELGPVNLFSGGNGSGKTTAADAIQTVMTAAHENLFQFNPGQDETSQRGRGGKRVRTLASYVLGCDDGSYARLDPSDGYLAAVFHPTSGETAEPFTAVVCMRAWLDQSGPVSVARQEELSFLILPTEQLSLADFVGEAEGNRFLVPIEQLYNRLIQSFGRANVERYDTKKQYLRRLYGALRGRPDAVSEQEAVAAARAFSRFMAYKPVQSINRFVADEILERKDLGEAIRSISAQLKTIYAMERDAASLVESIQVLEQARAHSQGYIESWVELNLLDYTLAQHEYLERQRDYLAAKQEQTRQREALANTETAIIEMGQRRTSVHDRLVALEAKRMGIDALRQKDELDRARQEQERLLVEQGKTLLIENRQLEDNIRSTRAIVEILGATRGVAELETEALAGKILRHGRGDELDLGNLLQKDLTNDLSALEATLDDARALQHLHDEWRQHWFTGEGPSRRDRLASQVHDLARQQEQAGSQRRQKAAEIERLTSERVSYPAYVERALEAVGSQCPSADPRVLCDHVEVKDPDWQAAIEGYLGGARFSILVDAQHEAEAIRIVRAMPGRDNRARIIQGEKAAEDARRVDLHADSIVNALDFSHAVARHYLAASYGTVLQVDSAETLRRTRRGLTKDGMASGNYSLWRCDLPDSELVFGVAARQRALQAKQSELERIEADWGQVGERLVAAQSLLKAVDGLLALRYADTLGTMLKTHRELQRLEGLLAQMSLGEHEDLERELLALKQEEATLAKQEAELHQTVGNIQRRLEESDRRCKSLSDQQELNRERVEIREGELEAIAASRSGLDSRALLDQADRQAAEISPPIAQNQRREIENQLHSRERRMSEAIAGHNQRCRPGDGIVYQGFDGSYDQRLFGAICALQQRIDRVFNVLKNNILVEKHDKLKQLKASFNSAFVSHLCHAIYQSIDAGRRQIELLNKELQHHRFGSDRETFRFDSAWIPEYRDYAKFFEDLVQNPQFGDDVDLFEAKLSKRSRSVLERLMSMLLDEDEQRAFRELDRIADYRNYHRYEIYKEVEGKPPIPLSEYGTGSGGQLETPAYIIRAAAITSAFRFAEGGNHLRMVLVDEAFSKMDETRSREVIGYLTESLGLQLVFIMPTSKCGPFLDLISNEFVFAKCPSERPRGELNTRVLVDRKQCNRERICDLWAQHRRTIYHQAELDFMDEVLG